MIGLIIFLIGAIGLWVWGVVETYLHMGWRYSLAVILLSLVALGFVIMLEQSFSDK